MGTVLRNKLPEVVFTARKRSLGQGNLFISVCQEFCTGGVVSQQALQVVSQHALQVSGGWYPSMPCRSPGPHPRGKLRGLTWGEGSPGPHRGVSQHALRQTPPQQTATAAGGMHPTGMHSCLELLSEEPEERTVIRDLWRNTEVRGQLQHYQM